jgi:hypothetical protein
MRAALAALWPEERLAAVYFAGVLLAFLAAGYPFNVLGMGYDYLRFFGAILAVTLPFWVVAQLARAARRRFDARRAGEDLRLFLRALLPLLLVLVAYTNLKARLFVFRPELADPWLARLDALVHFGGGDFIGWLLGFTGNRALDQFLAIAYVLAWAVFALPLGVAFARHGGRAARRALTALAIAYVVGGFLYFAAPSVGPAFFVRERFDHLAGNLSHALQSDMLRAMLYLVAHPHEKAIPFFGIAAFPSLHMATTFLGALVSGPTPAGSCSSLSPPTSWSPGAPCTSAGTTPSTSTPASPSPSSPGGGRGGGWGRGRGALCCRRTQSAAKGRETR